MKEEIEKTIKTAITIGFFVGLFFGSILTLLIIELLKQ